MIHSLTLLLLYQLAGELVAHALELPVPGPVIGLSLLFLSLLASEKLSAVTKAGATALLQHLSLFFVPAGAGVILYLDKIAAEWLPIAAALVVSTFAGLAVTALLIQAMNRRAAPPEERRS